jgi:hypothetical protein
MFLVVFPGPFLVILWHVLRKDSCIFESLFITCIIFNEKEKKKASSVNLRLESFKRFILIITWCIIHY